jgi:hypothetical protein
VGPPDASFHSAREPHTSEYMTPTPRVGPSVAGASARARAKKQGADQTTIARGMQRDALASTRDAESFFDSNILLYLTSPDADKADRVEELLAESGVISVQVLNEFANVASRKLSMSLADIREFLETVRSVCRTQPLTVEDNPFGAG